VTAAIGAAADDDGHDSICRNRRDERDDHISDVLRESVWTFGALGMALTEFLARPLSRSRIAIRLAWRPERRAALKAARQRHALIAALRHVGHRTLRDIGLGDDQGVDS
jgi:hypothetical protein